MIPLIVKLKQHTPIIHFLRDQDGATLRATELKPKLDKFLIEKLDGVSPLNMRVGSGLEKEPALAYKVRITQQGKPIRSSAENIPMYFGDPNKVLLLYHEPTEVHFFSINPNLIKLIKDNIAEFFAKTNFGMRQSKGYGSFYIHPEDEYYREIDIDDGYKLAFDSRSRGWEQALQQLDHFYKFLRSGINIPKKGDPVYSKSVAFLYAMKKLKRQWDKKSIKEEFLGPKYHQRRPDKSLIAQQQRHKDDGESPVHYSDDTEPPRLLIRDLFGLSTSQTWQDYNKAELKKKHRPTKGKAYIDRMKSPLTFKLVEQNSGNFKVYLFAEPVPDQVLGERFKIEMDKVDREANLYLVFPDTFDWEDFFKFLKEKVDIDAAFKRGRSSSYYKNINHILNQIQD